MTSSSSDWRLPIYTLTTNHQIMNLIKRDVIPWVAKASLVKMQQRSLFHQSFYKYHQRLQADKNGIAVWRRRSYLPSKEGV